MAVTSSNGNAAGVAPLPRVDLDVFFTEADGRAEVRLVGELDGFTEPALSTRLDELVARGFREIVMDVERLTFMSSTGLHLLARIRNGIGEDGRLVIRAPCAAVARALEISGLAQLFVLQPESAPADRRPAAR